MSAQKGESPALPSPRDFVAAGFRSALAQLSELHEQEVQGLQLRINQLHIHIKRLETHIAKATQFEGAHAPELLGHKTEVELGGQGWHSSVEIDGDTAEQIHSGALPVFSPCFWTQGPAEGGPGERASSCATQLEDSPFPDGRWETQEESSLSQDARLTSEKAWLSGSKEPAGNEPGGLRVQATRLREELERLASPAERRVRLVHRPRTRAERHRRTLMWYVEHPLFDILCAVVIVLNAVLIAAGVDWMTRHTEENVYYSAALHVCSGFFLVELVLRMRAHGFQDFFMAVESRNWNIFDFILVFLSGVDLLATQISSSSKSGIGTGMVTVKMLRIVRVFRVFRFFRDLRLLALMIVDSMRSLVWAVILLAIIIFVFAIWFTQRAVEYMNAFSPAERPYASELPELNRLFGSLDRCLYTLVQSALGGVSWGVVTDALFKMNLGMGLLFFFYVAFTILAVLNIITGVFVDNAVETAQTQREFLVQKEMELKERYIMEMKNLFKEMDSDANGTVTIDEIKNYLMDSRVMSYFQALGLDPHDTERLFQLIDNDDSGGISIDEFLTGCLRLKGQARSIDIHALIHDFNRVAHRLDRIELWITGPRSNWSSGRPSVQMIS